MDSFDKMYELALNLVKEEQVDVRLTVSDLHNLTNCVVLAVDRIVTAAAKDEDHVNEFLDIRDALLHAKKKLDDAIVKVMRAACDEVIRSTADHASAKSRKEAEK